MYIWKCWRDTRSFFIAFLVLLCYKIEHISSKKQ